MKENNSKPNSEVNLIGDLTSLGILSNRVKMIIANPASDINSKTTLLFPTLDSLPFPTEKDILEALENMHANKSYEFLGDFETSDPEFSFMYEKHAIRQTAYLDIYPDSEVISRRLCFGSLKEYSEAILGLYYDDSFYKNTFITFQVDGKTLFHFNGRVKYLIESFGQIK